MTAGTGYEQLNPSLAERVDRVCDAFEQAWRDGPRPHLESHIDGPANGERLVLLRELILVDTAYRRKKGEVLDPDDYLLRFPDLEKDWLIAALAKQFADRDTVSSKPNGRKAIEIPGFEVLGELGRGGMGVVYKARQTNLQRLVALKAFHPGAEGDEQRRFRAEALAVARLRHPNIVQIYDVGEQEGRPYLVLEYVENGSLDRMLDDKPIAPSLAANLVQTLAKAIQFAHDQGIIHRDLKPANILIVDQQTQSITPKVTDFGLARFADPSSQRTQSGTILGTPNYMAPEQAEGRSRDTGPAADVYALGAILYECLTGRPPFVGESPLATLDQVRRLEPISVRRLQPSVPADLNTICLKCLSKDPRRRYGRAADLAEDLGRFLTGRPITARPTGTWEHFARWCRRNPVVASLLIALMTALTGGLIGVLAMWQQAVHEAGQKTLALGQAQTNLEKARTNLYLNGISLAQRDYLANHLDQARRHLDSCPSERGGWEWQYLDRLLQNEPRALPVHSRYVSGLVFSPNGDWLAVAHADGNIKTWMSATGSPRLSLKGEGPVRGLAISPDGKALAASFGEFDRPSVVKMWDAVTGRELLSQADYSTAVAQIAFSPDGKRLAVADGPVVRIRDAMTGQEHSTLRPAGTSVAWVAYSPDGRRLATASMVRGRNAQTNGHVTLWDATSGAELKQYPPFPRGSRAVIFSRDSLHLGMTGIGTVKVWNLATDLEEKTLSTPGAFAFSADNRHVIVPDSGNTLNVWNLATGREEFGYRGHRAEVTALATSSDGRWMASADNLGTVLIWDATSAQDARTYRRDFNEVSLAFSPDGRWLAGAGRRVAGKGVVQVWDAETGKAPRTFATVEGELSAVAFHPDGTTLATAGGPNNKGEVLLWDTASGRKIGELVGHTARARAVAFNSTGNRVASSADDQTVRIWDTANGQCLQEVPGPPLGYQALAFSPNGQWLATVGRDPKTIEILDAVTGQLMTTLIGHQGRIIALAFSPDSQALATASADERSVKIWDVSHGTLMFAFPEVARSLVGLTFTPDGRRLIGAGSRTVTLWDAATGREVLTLGCHFDQVVGLAMSRDGRRLAVSGTDRTIQMWEAASPR